MKKPAKRVFIGTVLLIILIVPLFIFYLIKFRAETAKMASLETQEIISGVYAVKDTFVNMFLIKGIAGYLAIDAGNNARKIEKEIEKLNIDRDKVLAVLLTHSDADHVAAVGLFKRAKVYLSQAEEQMVNGQTSRALVFKNRLKMKYELLEDNQEMTIDGINIKCISTPGHTPGSMCYVINDQYLFTGDTMSLKNGKAGLFNEFFNMDSEAQLKSIRKISNLPQIRYLITAHYGLSKNYREVFTDFPPGE